MSTSIYQIDPELVKNIPWTGDPIDFDTKLFRLGKNKEEFIVPNPNIAVDLENLIKKIPTTNRCIVWYYKDQWVAKKFNKKWHPDIGYFDIQIPPSALKFNFLWTRNPDLEGVHLSWDPFRNYKPTLDESYYELVWYLDPKYSPNDDKIWVVKCKNQEGNCLGTKDMGYLSPPTKIIYNPELPELSYNLDYKVPWWDLTYTHQWMLAEQHCEHAVEELWAYKIDFCKNPQGLKIAGDASPLYEVELNPELPELDYEIDYAVPHHDFEYEHIWMLDSKHCENAVEEIWAFKIKWVKEPVGSKIVDYASPSMTLELNPDLPDLDYEIDYVIPYHDLGYDHVWMLDKKHTVNLSEEIWACKLITTKKPVGTKILGEISPKIFVEINKDVKGYSFDVPIIDIQYHDLSYKYVYMLDRECSAGFDIWALKLSCVKKSKEQKVIGSISAKQEVEFNNDLGNLKIRLDYKIPYHDRFYEHVWHLDPAYTDGEKVWAAKITATNKPKGIKEMGIVVPEIKDNLDVIFISYYEPNAEENWQRVLEKAPWAKRINGVKGIFEAHKAAAKLANTDMFYVVDGDAYLVDEWQFDYQPSIFERDCAYVWLSRNPVNYLEYGHGGVKLFSKQQLIKTRKWSTLDMTLGIMPNLKFMDKVSNVNCFNTDEYSTWRTAFRECVKLYVNNQMAKLYTWSTQGRNKPFGSFAIEAAQHAEDFVKKAKDNKEALLQINDYQWLKKQFNKHYSKLVNKD